jgi:predicted DNA-binding transcriptional regulator AlpA
MDGSEAPRQRYDVTAKEVCTRLNISLPTLRKLVGTDQVPRPIQVGNVRRWRRDTFETFLLTREREGGACHAA